MKKTIYIALVSTCALLFVGAYSALTFASSSTDNEVVKQSLSKFKNVEYGDIQLKGSENNIRGKNLLLAEDNKFKYKIYSNSGKMATLMTKNMEDFSVESNTTISQEQIKQLSDKDVAKFVPNSQNCKYTLKEYTSPDKDNEKCHQVILEEVADNGVKTGSAVSLTYNKQGKLIALAHHEGNSEVALKTSAKIAKNDAIKIALDYAKSKAKNCTEENLIRNATDLTVWDNNLVWKVQFDKIQCEGNYKGYIIFVNAVSGSLVYSDGYCALN